MDMLTPEDIRTIRKKTGLTATDFAHQLGVSENTVRRWESGIRRPRWDMMEKLNGIKNNGNGKPRTR